MNDAFHNFFTEENKRLENFGKFRDIFGNFRNNGKIAKYERLYFVSGFIRTACKLFWVGRSARRSAGRSAGRPARRPAGRSSAARVSSAAPKKNHLIEAAPFGRLDQM